MQDRSRRASRAVVVSSVFKAGEVLSKMGVEAYSYHFVFRAFAPLLEKWGVVREVTHAESRLEFALYQARREGLAPLHLSFLPLHSTYLTRHAPNVAFPFWEFPDIPAEDERESPAATRHNWVRIANRHDLIMTASTATRDALLRAGVRRPIHVVPVPVPPEYFKMPAWQPDQEVILDCPCYLFPQPPGPPPPQFDPWVSYEPVRFTWKGRLRAAYKFRLRRRMPGWVDGAITQLGRFLMTGRWHNPNPVAPARQPIPHALSPALPLSGVVYTTICNPFDPRKNWEDLLSAYLRALHDREDATLVIKLAVNAELAGRAFRRIFWCYKQLPQQHRCRVAVVAALLSDAQMIELTRASTYYVNTAHAEGACLPLQCYLAAGRPGIAPVHSALAEYFDHGVGLVVSSTPEPAAMPHTPSRRQRTTWHRLDWQSLHDQFQASYELARSSSSSYDLLARRGRERLAAFAGGDAVWPRLAAALDESLAINRLGDMPRRRAS